MFVSNLLIFAMFLVLLLVIASFSFIFFSEDGFLFGFSIFTILAVAYLFYSYNNAEKIVVSFVGAKEVEKSENPYLVNLVEGLSLAAGIPTPKIYIIDEQSINAFATGLTPKRAAVVFTRGAVEKLNRAELEGVAAHEISHIKNFDSRLMTVAVITFGLILTISDITLRWISSMRYSSSSNRGKGGSSVGLLLLIAVIFIILSPLFAFLIRLAISREREYLADASAVQLTRYPEGLASALEKIKNIGSKVSSANISTSHLFIANPINIGLFSTHPPIEERIKRLRSM